MKLFAKKQYIILGKSFTICDLFMLFGCAFVAILMYARSFFGTDITDEAFYVSDAIAMLHGNVPYAYNNFSYGTGCAFLLIPQIFLYEIFVPDHAGLILFTRLSYQTFRFVILFIVYNIVRKTQDRTHALLLIGMMIPFGLTIQNYSYNTIPCYLCFLVAFLIYDALENQSKKAHLELIFSGFCVGIAVFAHPGYGLALMIFLALILIRAPRGAKFKYVLEFIAGGLAEILIVMLPIIWQVGFATLWHGIDVMIFHKFPSRSTKVTTKRDVILTLLPTFKRIIFLFVIVFIITVFCARICSYISNRNGISFRESLLLGIVAGTLLNLLRFMKEYNIKSGYGIELGNIGILAGVCIIFLLLCKPYKDNCHLIYLGLYPLMFSVAECMVVATGVGVGRFEYSYVVLFAVFITFLSSKNKLIKLLSVSSIILCIAYVTYVGYQYVYRDDSIRALKCQVQSGVYKGIYTTAERASDLPELEEYLNSLITEDDIYAFRDNVPCGYLMVHQGIMCDVTTWDKMQYTYNGNAPAPLYDYYKRRDMIPDRIIYIDYERDERLSIETDTFQYNIFVNTYYDLAGDIQLNDTFKHIMVYEYNGAFDGDYDYWIDTYRDIIVAE